MTNKTALTVLHLASGDLWAGAEVQLFTLARKLAENPDITVIVVLLNHGKLEQKLKEEGIKVNVIDEATTGPLRIFIRLISLMRRSGADIIHTHRTKENIIGSLAGLLAGGIPSLRTVHGAPEHRPSLKQAHKYVISMLDQFCARFLQQAIIAVSSDLASMLENRHPNKKLRIIQNGIDLDEFTALRSTHPSSRDKHHGAVKIGIAGRLVPVKRVDLFIETAHYMMEHHPEFTISYHIYGDGPQRQQLELLTHELSVSHLVHFEGHANEISAELASMDVLMMTSDHEGTPMVLLEALALGVTVIAHSKGGITEVLDNGKCGFLVNNHSPSGYAARLVDVINCADRHELPGQKMICHHLESKYSASRNAEQYVSVYRMLTGCKK